MDNKTLKFLREDLIGELQAIDQYQDHIDETDNEEVKHLLTHIMTEEKEHVAEIVKLLRKLDPDQEKKFQEEGD